jgi:hypothetical protein
LRLLQEVLTYPGRLPGEYGPGLVGSTATTAVVDLGRAQLVIANVGDSRGVLCKGGRAVRLTAEHTVAEESERDRIERNGGEVEADRVSAGCVSNELASDTPLEGVKRCSCHEFSLGVSGRTLCGGLIFRRTVVAESRKVGGTLKHREAGDSSSVNPFRPLLSASSIGGETTSRAVVRT